MTCDRCRREGLQPGEGNPAARLLKRATAGCCADCSITAFLRTMPPLSELLEVQGPQVLLNPIVQQQVARILASGQADARPEEIDWARVVENWELPLLRKKGKRHAAD